MPSPGPSRLGPKFVVELVGPPGSGKSTIFEGLGERSAGIRTAPTLTRGAHVVPLAWHAAAVASTLVRRRLPARRFSRDMIVMMAYLRALPPVLRRDRFATPGPLLFDQGPIFTLSRPAVLDARLAAWRREMFATWGGLLDAVVCLDAPDEILLERINTRRKPHRLKDRPDAVARETLAQTRTAYEGALGELRRAGFSPAILRFDTSRRTAAEIIDEILALIPPA